MAPKTRIAITSDLHYDSRGQLTRPDKIHLLAARMRRDHPDAVVIAGDLAHGLADIESCLRCFRGFDAPVGVLFGNHDVWRDPAAGLSSLDLWLRHLPKAVEDSGAVLLEKQSIRIRDVEILGSMTWYDYSALDPGLIISADRLARMKHLVNNDGNWIDWEFSDPEFAGILLEGLRSRIQRSDSDDGVAAILVVTHVPILEQQMMRKPHDEAWALSNAYFGNLTAGQVVLSSSKVRAIVSGHTHIGRKGSIRRPGASPVVFSVVPSEYGDPEYVLVEV